MEIKIPKTFMGKPVAGSLERVLNSGGNPNPNPPTTPVIVTPASTGLAYFTIPQITYRSGVFDADILKTFLDNGTVKTQDDWASYSENARVRGEFYTILKRAFDLKDDPNYKFPVEEMRTTIQKLSREKWLMTLTRIGYSSQGNDTINHNFGLSDKYQSFEGVVGSDGEIPAGSSDDLYHSLLGTGDSITKIKDVFRWLNETPTYIWRVNSKPKSNLERVARFGASSAWAGLVCDGDPTDTSSSLGVRLK